MPRVKSHLVGNELSEAQLRRIIHKRSFHRRPKVCQKRRERLRYVYLRGSTVSVQAIAKLELFPRLEWLDLAGCKGVTKDVLRAAAKLKCLQILNLERTEIQQEWLRELLPLANLRWIGLLGTGVTRNHTLGLKEELPRLVVSCIPY